MVQATPTFPPILFVYCFFYFLSLVCFLFLLATFLLPFFSFTFCHHFFLPLLQLQWLTTASVMDFSSFCCCCLPATPVCHRLTLTDTHVVWMYKLPCFKNIFTLQLLSCTSFAAKSFCRFLMPFFVLFLLLFVAATFSAICCCHIFHFHFLPPLFADTVAMATESIMDA